MSVHPFPFCHFLSSLTGVLSPFLFLLSLKPPNIILLFFFSWGKNRGGGRCRGSSDMCMCVCVCLFGSSDISKIIQHRPNVSSACECEGWFGSVFWKGFWNRSRMKKSLSILIYLVIVWVPHLRRIILFNISQIRAFTLSYLQVWLQQCSFCLFVFVSDGN